MIATDGVSRDVYNKCTSLYINNIYLSIRLKGFRTNSQLPIFESPITSTCLQLYIFFIYIIKNIHFLDPLVKIYPPLLKPFLAILLANLFSLMNFTFSQPRMSQKMQVKDRENEQRRGHNKQKYNKINMFYVFRLLCYQQSTTDRFIYE